MEAWAASHAGRVRESNQDAHFAGELQPGTGVYCVAVADGMGGHAAGEVASRLALGAAAAWLRHWAQTGPAVGGEVGHALLSAFYAAGQAIAAAGRARPEREEMGTTLTAVLVCGRRAWLGHIGDSRAYLVRAGRLSCLTRDHSVAAEMVRAGSLSPEKVQGHPLRSVLTRALGAKESSAPDISDLELACGDLLLLCTDGLTAVVAEEELAREALACHPRDLAARLVSLANERGGPDNVTVVVGRVGGEGEV